MIYFDKFTGKQYDLPSDALSHFNGHKCEYCGSECIDRCFICGAPQCCLKCCMENSDNINTNK